MDQNTGMDQSNHVVARFLDGRIVKGTTQDFVPTRPMFHVQHPGGTTVVPMRQLKAVFFVRDLAGDPTHKDLRGFLDGPGETTRGRKIAVRFKDNELVCGYSLSYSPDRPGFFVFPSDPGSNNLRIFVFTAA